MVEWEKWALFAFVILAIVGALFVNAEQNRQRTECCCIQCSLQEMEPDDLCNDFYCEDYPDICEEKCEGTEWQK